MKVLKKGRGKGWKRRVECNACDAQLEVEDTDCKLVSDQRDGDFYSTTCPECGNYIAIAAKLVGGRR